MYIDPVSKLLLDTLRRFKDPSIALPTGEPAEHLVIEIAKKNNFYAIQPDDGMSMLDTIRDKLLGVSKDEFKMIIRKNLNFTKHNFPTHHKSFCRTFLNSNIIIHNLFGTQSQPDFIIYSNGRMFSLDVKSGINNIKHNSGINNPNAIYITAVDEIDDNSKRKSSMYLHSARIPIRLIEELEKIEKKFIKLKNQENENTILPLCNELDCVYIPYNFRRVLEENSKENAMTLINESTRKKFLRGLEVLRYVNKTYRDLDTISM
jgi:hypothetical protein